MSRTVLLADMDYVCYAAGFAAEKKQYVVHDEGIDNIFFDKHAEAIAWLRDNGSEHGYIEHERFVQPVENALQNTHSCVDKIQAYNPGAEIEVYLTGKGNFRNDIATIVPYKGNRGPFTRPVHYQAIRDYLVSRWNAKVVEGMEADDEVSIRSYELRSAGDTPIVVSNDKDLLMVEGQHYDWTKGIGFYVTEEEAWRAFFTQLLTGDDTDNIKALYGVGPSKAAKILAGKRKPRAMLAAVWETWNKQHPDGYAREDGTILFTKDALTEVASLLWLRRSRIENTFDWSFVK